ncbi:Chemotaxis protein methyltransferase (modular protein) [Candidatus Terasakiella magnetica]|uniref:protein-glutamate O-methyltransferase n=1 Tax=Candidatus Terasakiella magnetica TaxID=1867952 RepID=A0A1C3RKM5_9PROT|nr:Chemotaxis protein methyltransferase (modular protein) [Candidatus Terasakiella magnetica]
MRPDDFQFLATLVKERSGLVLTQDKSYLLESRLMPVARKRGMKGLEDLVAAMKTRMDNTLADEITEAMTTNESFFFRDIKPFDIFRDTVLPNLLKTRASKKTFRIWCAAASSGQEPYSIAMVLKEAAAQLAGWRIEIVGTDISKEMLDKAQAGLYSQFEVQRGLPVQQLVKYFKKRDDLWQIDSALRGMVQYKEFNLLEDMKSLGTFDVVFCRNVLIYFDQQTKGDVLGRMAKQMSEDGVLYLGGAETVLGISDAFKPVQGLRGIYSRPHCAESLGTVSEGAAAAPAPAPAAPTGFAKPKHMVEGRAPKGAEPSPAARPGVTPRPAAAPRPGAPRPASGTTPPPRPAPRPGAAPAGTPPRPTRPIGGGAGSTTKPGSLPPRPGVKKP